MVSTLPELDGGRRVGDIAPSGLTAFIASHSVLRAERPADGSSGDVVGDTGETVMTSVTGSETVGSLEAASGEIAGDEETSVTGTTESTRVI